MIAVSFVHTFAAALIDAGGGILALGVVAALIGAVDRWGIR